MNAANKDVLANVISAVESGGQIYGKRNYKAYADPYQNTPNEHTITLGWAQNLTETAKYCPTPFYLWKWRDDSVCRHDPEYILKTYNNMLDSNDALVDEFSYRGKEDKAVYFVGFMVFDAYYTMNKQEWTDKTNLSYRMAVENRFGEYFKKHAKQWEKLSQQEKMIISNGVRTRSINEGMPMETITIESWLNKVVENENI